MPVGGSVLEGKQVKWIGWGKGEKDILAQFHTQGEWYLLLPLGSVASE